MSRFRRRLSSVHDDRVTLHLNHDNREDVLQNNATTVDNTVTTVLVLYVLWPHRDDGVYRAHLLHDDTWSNSQPAVDVCLQHTNETELNRTFFGSVLFMRCKQAFVGPEEYSALKLVRSTQTEFD